MAIRLLALDLDGTLLNSQGEISARNFEAIRQARELKVNVAIVTGRRFRDARPVAIQLGLDVPVISHNGALTKHARTLETIKAHLLQVETARRVVAIGRAEKADALVSDDAEGPGILVYDHISEGNLALGKYIAWTQRVVGDDAGEAVRRVDSLDDYLDHSPIHIAFSGGCDHMARLAVRLEAELGDQVKILRTVYLQQDFALVDVLPAGASKGEGVAAAAAELSLTSDEVMAIGDNHNDLEMLLYAGTPVVMANAEPALKNNFGFFETQGNDEHGVALAIERFILNTGNLIAAN